MSTKAGSTRQRQTGKVKRSSRRSTSGKERAAETISPSLYPLAVVNDTWTSSSKVKITDISGTNILSIPYDFLSAGQECNWQYIGYLIAESVKGPGELWTDGSKTLVDLATDVEPGCYTYVRHDDRQQPCTPRQGPEGKRKGRPPNLTNDASTVSDSGRSSAHQSAFRFRVAMRDGVCVVTGVPGDECEACHIVPNSRPDLYDRILGAEQHLNRYQDWAGLLLASSLHKHFDRFAFALYPRETDYIIHVFDGGRIKDLKSYHGKVIPFGFFRGHSDARPKASLLAFHYRQCVQIHFRGYSHRISAHDVLADL